MSVSPELVQRAIALHRAMTAMEDSIFLPTGGAFLTTSWQRMRQLKAGELGDIADADVWSAYAEWHETVHMAQLVTCPFVRIIGFRFASIANEAHHRPRSELRDDYREVSARLASRTPQDISPWDVFETHAVVQGLLWLLPEGAEELEAAAQHLYLDYKSSPEYLRLLRIANDLLGDQPLGRLLSRLCLVALQTMTPDAEMSNLLQRIRAEGSAAPLADCTPRQFCEWHGIDASWLAKSLRERDPKLESNQWMRTFGAYFARYEQIADTDERLNLLFGVSGASSARMFTPTFTVYPNGIVKVFPPMPEELEDECRDTLITVTSNLVEGLSYAADG